MNAKKTVVFVIGTLLLLVFLSLMFTYQVRSTEIVLVQSIFGDPEIKDGNQDAGLHFKLPWPLQEVYKLDGRVHVVETGFDQELAAGGETVLVSVYAGWFVKDAEQFRKKFSSAGSADDMMLMASEHVRGRVVNARSEAVGTTKLEDLLDNGQSLYDTLEKKLLAAVQGVPSDAEEEGQSLLDEAGLEIKFLGIKRVGLTETIANGVVDSMAQFKQKQIDAVTTATESEEGRILTIAQNQAKTIVNDAENNATKQKSEAMEKVQAQFVNAETNRLKAEVAITLKKIKALEALRAKPIQLIISDNHPLFNIFSDDRDGAETQP
ncbi:MAG: hypothetical protein CMO74_06065 [Verrucomicrobiales bacterium]|nr:hypothetical protein [Verrucomicrobiales bacterium]|tara:strand:+ start:3622 stop:4587 length:966 start_codon:yes stop_codon:yes gene_type:complete